MSLVFNSDADGQDLVSEVLRICNTDTNSYPLKDITRRANAALDHFAYLAFMANGLWEFDDLNNTSDIPVGVTDLVSGQYDYSFATDVLLPEKVFCKDSSGLWQELLPVDITNSKDTSKNLWTLPSGNTGSPTAYDKISNSLLLDPVPNYNSSGGLKVVFQRGPSYFVSTDTTKKPGIPSIFHMYLARYTALPFLIDNTKGNKNDVADLITVDEIAIQNFYAARGKDDRRGFSLVLNNDR